MRAASLAVVALVAAALGGALALAGIRATGWLSVEHTRTVVVGEAAPPVGVSRSEPQVATAKPLIGNGFRPDRIYSARSAGVVTVVTVVDTDRGAQGSQGTGFVVSRRGYILTNSHVITNAGEGDASDVQPASEVYVTFANGDRVAAQIIGWDLYDDVGVLQVDPKEHPLQPVPLGDSSRVRVGEPVAVIGSPFGNQNSLSVGVVAATKRSIQSLTGPTQFNLVDAIQIDAPINHGNSGGPLFDARGRVIGITAQIRNGPGTTAFEGVGFAVPINSAKRSLAQLVANGEVEYAYVGITTEDLTPALARRYSYPVSHGAVIDEVRPGTPASRAGLHGGSQEIDVNGTSFTLGGDVVVGIGGHTVRHADDLVRIVSEELRPGQVTTFDIFRGRTRMRVPVKLAERPVDAQSGR